MRAPEFWREEPGLLAGLLTPLGSVWDAASHFRRAVTRPYRGAVPVICVGNLVAGGSGKTPVVLSLAGIIAAARVDVHIVSRGYGGRLAGPLRVDPAAHDAAVVGDEALLAAQCAPSWIARDRAAGIRAASAAGAALVILDDGFQNPTITKDLSLVVVDAEYGFGNGRVIPAGPLRESAVAGLARADAVVLIGDAAIPGEVLRARRPVLRARLEPVNGDRLAGADVVAFAGIARPEKFFASLRAVGARVLTAMPFPDHHRFTARELAGLESRARRTGARLVTTAKDWVRLPAAMRGDIAVLEVAIAWEDPGAVNRLLAGVLQQAGAEFGDGKDRRAARG